MSEYVQGNGTTPSEGADQTVGRLPVTLGAPARRRVCKHGTQSLVGAANNVRPAAFVVERLEFRVIGP